MKPSFGSKTIIKNPLSNVKFFRIRRFPADTEYTLYGEVELSSTVDLQKKAWSRPPIHMEFQVPMFTSSGLHITLNGRLMGDIPDPRFAELMLATFIGREPPTPRLKQGLLGLRD